MLMNAVNAKWTTTLVRHDLPRQIYPITQTAECRIKLVRRRCENGHKYASAAQHSRRQQTNRVDNVSKCMHSNTYGHEKLSYLEGSLGARRRRKSCTAISIMANDITKPIYSIMQGSIAAYVRSQ